MSTNEKQISYSVSVYNKYVDYPIATASIEEFDFNELLSHPNHRVREFSFIDITKCIKKEKTTIVKPLIVIYKKKDWEVKTVIRGNCKYELIGTLCSCGHHWVNFNGILVKVPCNNQEEIINRFNTVSKMLVSKNKVKCKSLLKRK